MVPDVAARKILDRIAMAKRLGFPAEALGLLRALTGQAAEPAIYGDREQRRLYELGYRDAQEIIAVEAHLAAKVGQVAA